MRIDQEVKLDFKDVLFKPKRSTLTSRKDVDLTRTFEFQSSKKIWTGVPIMASNMDGVGTFEMAKVFQEYQMITVLSKHYTIKDWQEAIGSGVDMRYISVCTGTGAIWDTESSDWVTMNTVLKMYPDIPFICVDVANGYHENYSQFVAKLRDLYPDKIIIAGNVITGEMTEELILNGADIVKCGIGPGCFAPGQKVKTNKGLKNIEDIKQGEKVLTHTGSYKTVTKTFRFDDKKSIIDVNGIKATPNHEFYVLHKKHRDIVTDNNIHQYAEWIEAKDLTKDYLLLRHK